MVTNSIDFVALKQKTSKEFVDRIENTVELVSTWKENEIQFHIEEDEYKLIVTMCYFGSISKHEYRFSTKENISNQIYWTDIRKFFDIPFEMKKLTKAE